MSGTYIILLHVPYKTTVEEKQFFGEQGFVPMESPGCIDILISLWSYFVFHGKPKNNFKNICDQSWIGLTICIRIVLSTT